MASYSHLVLIPSYNTGPKVIETVNNALAVWQPVWVVVDGSADGTAELLQKMALETPGLKVFVLPRNQGKGAAVLHGLQQADAAGYSYVLTMDADGQHPARMIPEFMQVSQQNPGSAILGKPVFDASAPALRVKGRKISNWWANLETLGAGIGDSLFGLRVYPIQPLRHIMESSRWMRRFDFDPEVAVRLCWAGVRPVNIESPVKYFTADEGGVSHFKYLRDNTLLTWMHMRLLCGFLLRLPLLLMRKWTGRQDI